MVIEPHAAARVVRHVGQNVVGANLDFLVRDVLRVDEDNLVDRLLESDDDGAGQAIEITTGHQPHDIVLPPRCKVAQVE